MRVLAKLRTIFFFFSSSILDVRYLLYSLSNSSFLLSFRGNQVPAGMLGFFFFPAASFFAFAGTTILFLNSVARFFFSSVPIILVVNSGMLTNFAGQKYITDISFRM